MLSIPNLAQRLNDRFKILTGGSRTALPRQKTLVALINWSYELLTAQEQMLFNRLGIFAGSFSLDAVMVACASDGIDASDVLDILSSLSDKSLIMADTSGEQERYRLLESTRAYALDKLAASGERERLARGHAEYFRDLAQSADTFFAQTNAWLASAELEIDNYRAALEWALTKKNDAVIGAAIARSLSGLWVQGGLVVEGRYWTGPALERIVEGEQPQIAARLWLAVALLGEGNDSLAAAEQAVRLYAAVGDSRRLAHAQQMLAYELLQMGRLDEARDVNALALATFRERGDKGGVAMALNRLAWCERLARNFEVGREHYAQALAMFRALENDTWLSMTLDDLAWLEFEDGNAELALRLGGEALEIKLRQKHVTAIAVNYINGIAYRVALGDFSGARESASHGVRWARQVEDSGRVALAIQYLAELAALSGDVRRATQLLGYVDGQFEAVGWKRDATETSKLQNVMDALGEHLSAAEIDKLAAEGAAWSEDNALVVALRV